MNTRPEATSARYRETRREMFVRRAFGFAPQCAPELPHKRIYTEQTRCLMRRWVSAAHETEDEQSWCLERASFA